MRWLFVGMIGLCVSSPITSPPSKPKEDSETERPIVEALQAEAKRLSEFTTGAIGKQFVAAADHLPPAAIRTIYKRSDGTFISAAERQNLPENEREAVSAVEVPAKSYYLTRYGTPLAYSRAIDLVGNRSGWEELRGKKILDFGYGGIGQLKLLAACGADAVGVDVDSFLEALYSSGEDRGALESVPRSGTVTLIRGRWPSSEQVREEVGEGYDLFVSKNTLKSGYIHPERPVEKRFLVELGVTDEQFVNQMFQVLKPGGWAIIYNLYPPQSPPDERYLPWATGRCPFERPLLERVGFRVVTWNQDDTKAAREMAGLLEWKMDPKTLFAMFTILQKPERP